MPRNYGQTTTSIWQDPDFTTLDVAEQGVYFMLKFQPDITAAGTLPLTYRRFARNAADLTPETLEEHVLTLVKRGHLAVDADTEELLLVTFIKWDNGYGNRKRIPVIEAAARATRSPVLRSIIADELRRLDLPEMAYRVSPDTLSAERRDTLSGQGTAGADRESLNDRVVVNERGEREQPSTHNPQPEWGETATSPTDARATRNDAPPQHCSRHPGGTDQPCGACADARRAHAAWEEARMAAAKDRRASRAADREACPLCDENGMRLDPDTKQPLGRCYHTWQADEGCANCGSVNRRGARCRECSTPVTSPPANGEPDAID